MGGSPQASGAGSAAGDGEFPWTSACLEASGEGEDLDPWRVPEFCPAEDHWRYQLGYLLRFALSRSPDFTSNVDRSRVPAAPRYRSAVSSWVQRKYGGHHDQRAFGGEWLPISDWYERFLSALLGWPGRRKDEHTREIDRGIRAAKAWIEKRKQLLEAAVGEATEVQCLPMAFSSSYLPEGLTRLRGCIVQTIYPAEPDFDGDLTLSSEHSRSRHREHLTNALALVRQALRARRRESSADGPLLDLLVLPELSVHPDDVRRYLLPFAQAFKTIILAGVVYEELPPETAHLVNTVTWVIPEHSAAIGWNVRVRRQGKEHPAKPERDLREMGKPVRGYRPCQWIIECPSPLDQKPLRLSASVFCYDATDLAIASDLRERSDAYLIPALNRDVQTFDSLAIGLSYQMHQLVVVANNGKYGGSSAYWPIGKAHERRVMHLHGGNQPTLGFFEITDVPAYRRGREEESRKPYEWKESPAGYSAKHSNKR